MATATGGFVARAERQTLEVKTASGNVGPGAYNLLPSPSSNNVAAPAPFLSTKQRALMENTTMSAFTPGPGAYQAAQAIDAVQTRHAESITNSSAFASLTARLHKDKSQAGKPGPGAYDTGNAWLKHQHRYTAKGGNQQVNYQRVPSAPSIPYRHQCYGYEEGQQGSLVMQPPPDPILTGVGRDTVGPGAYNLDKGSSEPPKAVQWGASRTRRGLEVTSTTPGPGQYELTKPKKDNTNGIVVSIAGVDVQFGGASGTSQFASKVPLGSQRKPQEWERTPGPGAYNTLKTIGATPLPKELQFFGSSSQRASNIDPMRSLSAPTYFHSPGPAAYAVPSASVKIHQQSPSDPRPFNATSSRFGSIGNGVPGPGEYRPDVQVNLAKSIADKAAISKGGIFGSTADRWSGNREQMLAKLPGPGNYEAPGSPKKPVHKGNDSVFASKTDRFKPAPAPTSPEAVETSLARATPEQGAVRGDPARLGPGSYQLPDQWKKAQGGRHALATQTAGFGSNSQRPNPARVTAVPGPGRYNTLKDVAAAFKPLSVAGRDTVFGSQVQRFKGSGSFTPGPGQYEANPAIIRKSFNVTYNNGIGVA